MSSWSSSLSSLSWTSSAPSSSSLMYRIVVSSSSSSRVVPDRRIVTIPRLIPLYYSAPVRLHAAAQRCRTCCDDQCLLPAQTARGHANTAMCIVYRLAPCILMHLNYSEICFFCTNTRLERDQTYGNTRNESEWKIERLKQFVDLLYVFDRTFLQTWYFYPVYLIHRVRKNRTTSILGITLTKFNKYLAQLILTFNLFKVTKKL